MGPALVCSPETVTCLLLRSLTDDQTPLPNAKRQLRDSCYFLLLDVDLDKDEAVVKWTTPIPAPPKSPARTPRTMSKGRPSRAECRFLLALSMSASPPD